MSSEQETDENFDDMADEAHEGGDEAHATDADFTDEDWDAEGGADGDHLDESGDAPPKKKLKMNVIIIGGAVVVGLGILYMQMSKKPGALPPVTAQQAAVPAGAPTEEDMIYGNTGSVPQQKIEKGNKAPPGGFLNDPNIIKKVQKLSDQHMPTAEETMPESPKGAPKEQPKAAPPMPAPISQQPVTDKANPLTPLPQEASGMPFTKLAATAPPPPTPVPAPAAEKPVAPAPAAPPAPAIPVKPVEITAPPLAAAPAIPSVSEPTAAAPAGAANAQLDHIAAKLDGIESELKTLQESSARKDDLANLKTQLDNLQDKVSALEGRPAVKETGSAKQETASVIAKHHAHPRMPAVHHKTTSASAAPVVWTLKSAQPGLAIVSKSDGQLVTVKPGDKLQGLGTVRSIGEEKGRWIIKGSAGTVSQ